jgi:acyl-CoA thioester hydrolase
MDGAAGDFEARLLAGWGDVDALGHMANTAYLNKAADVRMEFLASHGYTLHELMRLGVVPIARRDEVDYFREFHFHDELRVNFLLGGISDDGSRTLWVNEFYRADALAARITTTIVFLDLRDRKLVSAPDRLVGILKTLPRLDPFVELPSALKS